MLTGSARALKNGTCDSSYFSTRKGISGMQLSHAWIDAGGVSMSRTWCRRRGWSPGVVLAEAARLRDPASRTSNASTSMAPRNRRRLEWPAPSRRCGPPRRAVSPRRSGRGATRALSRPPRRFRPHLRSSAMSPFTEKEIEYLRGQRLGRLATVGSDGSPHVVPVGFRLDAGAAAIEVGGHALSRSRSGGTCRPTRGWLSSSTIW